MMVRFLRGKRSFGNKANGVGSQWGQFSRINIRMAHLPDAGAVLREMGKGNSILQNLKPRNPPEFVGVAGHQRHAMHQRRGSDPEVIGSDEIAAALQMAVEFAVLPEDIRSPRQQREWTAKTFPGSMIRRRPAARQFSSDGEGHEELFFRVFFQKRSGSPGFGFLRLALHADDEVGIDDQAHGSSGGRSFFSASSTSSR